MSFTTILENKLYLSDLHSSLQEELLQQYHIDRIINVSEVIVPRSGIELIRKYKLLHISIPDSTTVNIRQYFDKCNEFIDRPSEGSCLIHCEMGLSRSPTIVLAYLLAKRGMRLREAYDYVLSKRRILPFHTIKQLVEYEKELYDGVSTLSVLDVWFDIYKYWVGGKLEDHEIREMVRKLVDKITLVNL